MNNYLITIFFTMKSITIKGSERESVGKAGALRNAGLVPCVLYGGNQAVHFRSYGFQKTWFTPNAHTVEIDLEKENHLTLFYKTFKFTSV
jgi:large subunit ribosomal protein L25